MRNTAIKIIPFIAILIWAIYYRINEKRKYKKFYHHQISSIIIKSKKRFARYEEFLLRDGNSFTLLLHNSANINIGDSLYKNSETFDYKIYRKKIEGGSILIAEMKNKNIIFK